MEENYSLNMDVSIDLEDTRYFIENDLVAFLVNNAPNFETSAFILQILLEKMDELSSQE